MKKIKFFMLAVVVVLFTACHDKLWDSIEDLDSRVTKLEELCKEMNTNISALQTIVEVIQENDFITGIVPIEKGGEVIGYTIMFGKHEPITIYNGEDGKDGQNGIDGKDGYTPILGVAKDVDGVYYWTLDGEWLLDAEGNKIRVTGRDGKDGVDGANGKDGVDGKDGQTGTNGADGKDGVTPQLKIEEGYWYISYDNGATWTELGKAVGEDGKDGTNGTDGKDGQDGKPGADGEKGDKGDSMFTSVTYDENNVYFTLTDGSVLIVPRGNSISDFDQTVIDNLVNSLTLDKEILRLENIGDIDTIFATTTPYPNSKVIWTSCDTNIIKINNGIVEAVNFGDIKIKVQAGDIVKYIYAQVGGPLKSKFSIGFQKYIYFSRGHLEYQKSTNIWRLAINQYDTLDVNNGWNDNFNFPTDAYSDVKHCLNGKRDISNTLYDWGYNVIFNGGNKSGLWRTLTKEEWQYMLEYRNNASLLCGVGYINGIYGIILLPDNWVLPEGGSFIAGKTINNYGLYEWQRMERNGAIFLIIGKTSATNYAVADFDKSNLDNKNLFYYLTINSTGYCSFYSSQYSRDLKVRLVQDIE